MVDEPDYEIIRKLGDVELRRYPKIILATVKGKGIQDAFGILFGYISGNNLARSKIPMTAPVINADQYFEKIPMTAPVITEVNSTSFIMPAGYSMDTIPEPRNQRVVMEEVPERTLAVLRFKGRVKRDMVKNRLEELYDVLGKEGMSVGGEPVLMQYNPPYTLGFLRRNEVAVEIVESSG
jgi:hypothetical protein